MAKIKRNLLKNVKNALREIKEKEKQDGQKTQKHSSLTWQQKQQIRQESFNDHKVKVTWNIHPGDLVKVKQSASPTGKTIFGLVTWGIKETEQRAPSISWKKDLRSYYNKVRVMSSAGYHFFPANSLIVIN